MTYFQCFVPTTRHDTAVVRSFYPVDCPDWTFMLNKTKKKKKIEAHTYYYTLIGYC